MPSSPASGPPVRLVTRYADVKAALTEPRLVRDRGAIPSEREEADPQDELMEAASAGLPAEYVKYFARHLALFDGEEHARRPAPLTRAFTARRIAALREFVERTADGLLGEAEPPPRCSWPVTVQDLVLGPKRPPCVVGFVGCEQPGG